MLADHLMRDTAAAHSPAHAHSYMQAHALHLDEARLGPSAVKSPAKSKGHLVQALLRAQHAKPTERGLDSLFVAPPGTEMAAAAPVSAPVPTPRPTDEPPRLSLNRTIEDLLNPGSIMSMSMGGASASALTSNAVLSNSPKKRPPSTPPKLDKAQQLIQQLKAKRTDQSLPPVAPVLPPPPTEEFTVTTDRHTTQTPGRLT